MLAQGQRVFTASKPKSLLMIFIFLTEFPTDALEDATSTNYSPMKSVHTKLPLKSPWDFSHIGNVVSTNLEYDYKWNFSSYDVIVWRALSSAGNRQLIHNISMTSVKRCFTQTWQSLYHPLWPSFERFTTLNYTNRVNCIDLYRYQQQSNFHFLKPTVFLWWWANSVVPIRAARFRIFLHASVVASALSS